MKRKLVILTLSIILVLCTLLTGCGNRAVGLGSYTFKHLHYSDAVNGHCATVESWHDNETGIEVRTTEHGPMFLSEGTYILYSNGDKCPYCK